MYIVKDLEQDLCFNTFEQAELVAKKLGYNTIRDFQGNKYYL
jgi:hypothetical protein